MNIHQLTNQISSLNIKHLLSLKKAVIESKHISTFDTRPYLIAIIQRQEEEMQTLLKRVYTI